MPDATINLPDGTKVKISGTEEEVARIVRALAPPGIRGDSRQRPQRLRPANRAGSAVKDYVMELHEGGKFDKPKGLTEVREALAAEGHIVPITTLSGVMLELARSKELRRFKENGTWKYVKR